MHLLRIVALDEERLVPISEEEMPDLLVAHPSQDGRIGDLVAVQMQDRQHRAIMRRIQELVGMPGRRERAGFGFAVADDAGCDQIGIVEHRAIGMDQRIAEFAAFVDRAGRLRRSISCGTRFFSTGFLRLISCNASSPPLS